MMSHSPLSVLIFLLLFLHATPGFSQEDNSWLYPDFVGDRSQEEKQSQDREEQDETIETEAVAAGENPVDVLEDLDDELSAAIEELEPRLEDEPESEPEVVGLDREDRRMQVLSYDLASSATWTGARNRILNLAEEMRISIVSQAPVDEFSELAREFLVSLDVLAEMAPLQAPFQQDAIVYQRNRLEHQVLYMLEDYRAGRERQVASMNRLVTKSLTELDSILARSDFDRGWDATDYSQLPGGWNPGEFAKPDFARHIRSWTGPRLLQEYSGRHSRLQHAYRYRSLENALPLTYEMGELARELARRTDEVPLLSRESFRNAALKLDVQAENLRDHIQQSRRQHTRRQIYYMGRSIRDAQRFLDLMP